VVRNFQKIRSEVHPGEPEFGFDSDSDIPGQEHAPARQFKRQHQ
jgi:hypothetical protein